MQKIILVSLVSVSAASWLTSQTLQNDMMMTMTTAAMMPSPFASGMGDDNNGFGLASSYLFFVLLWTVGMAAMMFPAITPMVFLYNRLASSEKNNSQVQVALQKNDDASQKQVYPFKTLLFVGGYLAVWSLTGFVLLLGWSMLTSIMTSAASGLSIIQYIYGAILVIAGAYQFSPLKNKCLGYCESPLSFFMRRWSSGATGAAKMGVFHGLYCLGCCWPYFLLMVALGWMNLLWMALFSGIIFGEKVWSKKGIWIARAAGIGFVIIGILVMVTGGSAIIISMPTMMSTGDAAFTNTADMEPSANMTPAQKMPQMG
ncbi:DUF2182 domain-containing protein [Candidatus Nitrososphaera evergladensis]|uniref:DUF2182 domain-containing protein n=1 Tax=Candidatus Nitrososphaera evergladensis TaxID=1459637 RepID=UPI001D040C6B|nr:DUF2182 domain-containing protein [Candidatus Nitrososphaera evergladensis]